VGACIEMERVHHIVRVRHWVGSREVDVLGPSWSASQDDRLRVDGPDRRDHNVVVLLHCGPGHTVGLIRQLVQHMILVLVCSGHVLPERHCIGPIRGSEPVVRVPWGEDMPVDHHIDAQRLAPPHNIFHLLLQRLVCGIPVLPDIHRSSEQVHAPVLRQELHTRLRVAFGEPV